MRFTMYSTCMASFRETLESSMKYNEPTQVLSTQWETEYCCSQNCMLAVWKSDKTKSSLNCSFEESFGGDSSLVAKEVQVVTRRVLSQANYQQAHRKLHLIYCFCL